MKPGIDLVELARRIEGARDLKQDYLAPLSQCAARVHDDKAVSIAHPKIGDLPILPLAHDQLGTVTGIPGRYYDKMLAEAPDLLVDNLNTWFRRSDENRMLRTLGGDLRAVLSSRYQRIEHEEVAEAVLPALFEVPGIRVVSAEVTDRRLYIHAVTSQIVGEVKVGDVVEAGVLITNSEVGLGALTVVPLMWRLKCLNGLRVNEAAMRRAHVGRRVDADDKLIAYRDDTIAADDKALLLRVRDTVASALSQTMLDRVVDKARGLTEGRITGDPKVVVEVLAKKVGMRDDEKPSILRSLIEGGDTSAWGLVNAVTHQAHTTASYDRAVEIEAAGGTLLDLPASDWREILAAA